jgi:hypothetical protein
MLARARAVVPRASGRPARRLIEATVPGPGPALMLPPNLKRAAWPDRIGRSVGARADESFGHYGGAAGWLSMWLALPAQAAG